MLHITIFPKGCFRKFANSSGENKVAGVELQRTPVGYILAARLRSPSATRVSESYHELTK